MAKKERKMKSKRITGFALITGASKGIGRALAIECAKNGNNLALVSLPNSGLQNVKAYISKHYSVIVKTLEIDLSESKAPRKIYRWAREERIQVQILINNAGIGHLGPFNDYSCEFYEKIIHLNIESVVLLTKLFLPEIQQQKKGYILNLGSLASFYPIPFKIVYAGSKTFIYSFSRALRSELTNTSVKVSVLCPGPIITSPEVIERIKQGGFWARVTSMRSQKMANIAINALFKGKAVIIPGALNKIFIMVDKFIPGQIKQQILTKKFNVKKKMEIEGSEKPFKNTKLENAANTQEIKNKKINV